MRLRKCCFYLGVLVFDFCGDLTDAEFYQRAGQEMDQNVPFFYATGYYRITVAVMSIVGVVNRDLCWNHDRNNTFEEQFAEEEEEEDNSGDSRQDGGVPSGTDGFGSGSGSNGGSVVALRHVRPLGGVGSA